MQQQQQSYARCIALLFSTNLIGDFEMDNLTYSDVIDRFNATKDDGWLEFMTIRNSSLCLDQLKDRLYDDGFVSGFSGDKDDSHVVICAIVQQKVDFEPYLYAYARVKYEGICAGLNKDELQAKFDEICTDKWEFCEECGDALLRTGEHCTSCDAMVTL